MHIRSPLVLLLESHGCEWLWRALTLTQPLSVTSDFQLVEAAK